MYGTEMHTIDSNMHDNANSHSKHSLFTRSIKRIQTSARTHTHTQAHRWLTFCVPSSG